MPVAVQGHWDTVALDGLFEHQHVAVGVLLLPKQGGGDRPGGVVDGPYQSQVGTPAHEPVVPAAVDLQQHPLLRVALTPAIALGGPARPRATHSTRQQNPPDRRARQSDPFALGQHLGQVGVVEPRVTAFGQRLHPLSCTPVRGRGRLPASVPVSYGRCSLLVS